MPISIDTTTPFGERAARRLRDEPHRLADHGEPGRTAAAEPDLVRVGRIEHPALLEAGHAEAAQHRRQSRASRLHLDGNGERRRHRDRLGHRGAQRRPARRPDADLPREVPRRSSTATAGRRPSSPATTRSPCASNRRACAAGSGHRRPDASGCRRTRRAVPCSQDTARIRRRRPLMSTTVPAPEKTGVRTLRNYVGGRWVDSSSSDFLDITNPATGDVLARVPLSSKAELDEAARTAREASEVVAQGVGDRARRAGCTTSARRSSTAPTTSPRRSPARWARPTPTRRPRCPARSRTSRPRAACPR